MSKALIMFDLRAACGRGTDPQIRFEQSYIPEPNSGCWLWIGTLKSGYPRIRIGNERVLGHRYSWLIHRGEIPDGLLVCHRCDNPVCVNPNHLFLGTPDDNMKDMSRKGRSARGTRSAQSKLTEADVLAIRDDDRQTSVIASEYQVSANNVRAIKNRVSWAHIP